jgi:glucokinase
MGLTIGVDIGGTKILAGVVTEDGVVLDRVKIPTPKDPEQTAAAIAEAVRTVRVGHDVQAVGLGAAGFVSADRATVMFAPNVAWHHEPLKARIEALVDDLPVVVENDANAAAWGEARFGAGAGRPDVVLYTVGTGIGGGIILAGELFRGHFGIGGEFGHYRVVPDGRLCGCGLHGCMEQYASGSALTRFVRERAAEQPDTAQILLSLGDGTPDGIVGAHITEAARKGDAAALAGFAEIAHWLGQSMADLASILDPEVFVVAGGVSDAGEILTGPARESYRAALAGAGNRPYADVVTATLGPDAGLIGAADLARRA